MRKLIAWNLMTLDGYFEGETPWDLSFHGRAWGPELMALADLCGVDVGLFVPRMRPLKIYAPPGMLDSLFSCDRSF